MQKAFFILLQIDRIEFSDYTKVNISIFQCLCFSLNVCLYFFVRGLFCFYSSTIMNLIACLKAGSK